MKIAVDFDGTCVKHSFPEIGAEIGAIPVLKELVEQGHHIILFTMRSGAYLDQAVVWFTKNDIPLHGINRDPSQTHWTSSPKAYAHLYIDDLNLGAPLAYDSYNGRAFINWSEVREMLVERDLLPAQ